MYVLFPTTPELVTLAIFFFVTTVLYFLVFFVLIPKPTKTSWYILSFSWIFLILSFVGVFLYLNQPYPMYALYRVGVSLIGPMIYTVVSFFYLQKPKVKEFFGFTKHPMNKLEAFFDFFFSDMFSNGKTD
jgi:hypothetical protein